MVKASRGNRARSRSLLRKSVRERGAVPPLSNLMKKYEKGEKVVIKINSSIHKGMPHRRYQGLVGTVIGSRGKAYLVVTKLGKKEKMIIVRPEHLSPLR
ncbi:50S ribosomal protein L21e [Sulfodiicoccus acidiphilus]|nr:50S ribosomal protein L21e [Sulfodiicoccus acidiphilus]